MDKIHDSSERELKLQEAPFPNNQELNAKIPLEKG